MIFLDTQSSYFIIHFTLLGLESQLGDLTQITCPLGADLNLEPKGPGIPSTCTMNRPPHVSPSSSASFPK